MATVEEILRFWFQDFRHNWFSCSDEQDKKASDFFEDCKGRLSSLFSETTPSYARKSLALIIIYDQLYRHYRRVKALSLDEDPYNGQTVAWVLSGLEYGVLDELSPEERCFYLMPLRHSKKLDLVNQSIEIIEAYDRVSSTSIYTRFLKAANAGRETLYDALGRELNERSVENVITRDTHHVDGSWVWPIIDQHRFSVLQRLRISSGWQTVDLYSPKRMLADEAREERKIYRLVKQQVREWQEDGVVDRKIAISLSGGVDSMLVAWALVELRREWIIDEVVAVHLNYRNRHYSDLEEQFVKNWCLTYNVPLYLRRIDELSRSHQGDKVGDSQFFKGDRQLYERYTRRVRFDLYSKLGCPIMLGHNRDDTFENIFTNISKCQHFDNLYGMEKMSRDLYGVVVLRPLLTVDKSEIVNEAITLDLYHTQNSTPVWSMRYKIRNKLMKMFEDHFPNFLVGLDRLASQLKELYQMEQRMTLEITSRAECKRTGDKLEITLPRSLICNQSVWGSVLVTLSHRYGFTSPSHKSVEHSFMQIQQRRDGMVNLSKSLSVRLLEEKLILVEK